MPAQNTPPPVDGSNALDPADYPLDEEHPDGPDLHLVAQQRPELDITNEADAIDGLLDIMRAGQLPDLYKRSGGPCWIHEDDQGNPLIKQLASDNLRAYLADHLVTYRVVADPLTEGTREERELMMPKTCATILGRKDWPLAPLRGIVTSPVARPDGSLLQAPGYDKPRAAASTEGDDSARSTSWCSSSRSAWDAAGYASADAARDDAGWIAARVDGWSTARDGRAAWRDSTGDADGWHGRAARCDGHTRGGAVWIRPGLRATG